MTLIFMCMKNWIIGLFLILSCQFSFGQVKAITENGDEVVLYPDGSWKFSNVGEEESSETLMNPQDFKKSEAATFKLKSNRFNVGFWINPKKWMFRKAEDNQEAEYEFQLKGEDLYAMAITEKIQIPLNTLKRVAVENAKSVAPDLTVVKEEYRMVNDLKVLHLRMDGTLQGVKFSYYGYYYSNENGSVQFIAYTAQGLMQQYMEDCENLLNGLVVLEENQE